MSPGNFDLDLENLYEKSVGQLLTDHFDLSAFDAFYARLCEKSELIKSEHVVSKQVLHYLLSAQQAVESRAAYLPAVRQHISLAGKFAGLLGLISIGEAHSDRIPGVPRSV